MSIDLPPIEITGKIRDLQYLQESFSSSSSEHSEKLLTAYKPVTMGERRIIHFSSVYIRNPHTKILMQEVKHRLRGIIAWRTVHTDIKNFGTSSGIFSLNNVYKLNLTEIMEEKKLTSFVKEKRNVETPRGMLHPDSLFKQIWNMLILLLLFYVFTATPWILAFEDVKVGESLFWFELFVDFLFLCDILITMNSAFFKDDVLVTSRCTIFTSYLKGLLLIDILAIFPFFLFENGEGGNKSNALIRIVRITKVIRIFKASKLLKVIKHLTNTEWMENCIKVLKMYDGITRLLVAVFVIVIMAHFSACMWYFTAKLDGVGPNTWVVRHGFVDSSKGALYLASLYWAFTILTTVGFGDIYAFTVSEMILCIIWMLFGIGFYSFLVGTLTSVLSSLDAKNSILQQNGLDIEKFLEDFNIDKKLLKKMKKQAAKNVKAESLDEGKKLEILQMLTKDTRLQICREMYKGAIQKIHFFKNKDGVFITNVVPRLNYELQHDLEYVYRKGDHPDSVYFIATGRVNYLLGRENTIFKSIVAGGYFGEIELLDKIRRKFSAHTAIHCEFLVMTKYLFNDIITYYPRIEKEFNDTAHEKKLKDLESLHEVIGVMDRNIIKKDLYENLAGQRPSEHAVNVAPSKTELLTPTPLALHKNNPAQEDQATLQLQRIKRHIDELVGNVDLLIKNIMTSVP